MSAFHIVLAVVLGLSTRSALQGMVAAWSSFWLWTLVGVGGLTVGFGLIEYFGGGKVPFTETFNPLELPGDQKAGPAARQRAG